MDYKNPVSGLNVTIEVDDPITFDEMMRDSASAMVEWLPNQDQKRCDIRDVFEFAMSTALASAKKRQCTAEDWYKFAGYSGLLAAQAIARQLWDANK